jgi:hypothetical protein
VDVSKVREVLREYATELGGHEPIRQESGPLYDCAATPGHLHWMCNEALSWPDERKEKMMRWLGFIQGVLCAHGVKALEDLKRDSMPAGATYE